MLRRPMVRMLAVVGIVVLALAAYKAYDVSQLIKTFNAPKPAISVSAARAQALEWVSTLDAVGTLKAHQGIDLAVEVAGTVTALAFNSGQRVEQGDLLLSLDSQTEHASLATAHAALELAQLEYARGENLIGRQAIAKSAFDKLHAELKKAEASVAQLQASLAKRSLRAPFSGTIGIRQVDVGAYLAAGSSVATLQDLSSLYVDFYLPEQYAPTLALGQALDLEVAALKPQRFQATISAINPKVDEFSRSLLVRATLAHPDQRLLPGMFASLKLRQGGAEKSIVVPETAVTFTLYGTSVYVVVADQQEPTQLRAEQRFIKTGERRAGQVVVVEGLAEGEQVVIAGQLKLSNQSLVQLETDPIQAP